jgi:hypothetical protein
MPRGKTSPAARRRTMAPRTGSVMEVGVGEVGPL